MRISWCQKTGVRQTGVVAGMTAAGTAKQTFRWV